MNKMSLKGGAFSTRSRFAIDENGFLVHISIPKISLSGGASNKWADYVGPELQAGDTKYTYEKNKPKRVSHKISHK